MTYLLGLCALFSFILLVNLLVSFSFPLAVTHATAVIFSRNSILSQIVSSKIQQGVNASQFSYLEILTAMPFSGNFPDSVEAANINKVCFFNCFQGKADSNTP